MDNHDSRYGFSRAANSREPTQQLSSGNWPQQFLPSRSQTTLKANPDTSKIWPQPSTWNSAEPGGSLRRSGTSPAPARRTGANDTTNSAQYAQHAQQASFMNGQARNSVTSIGLPPPTRADFLQNDSTDASLARQLESTSLNNDPYDTQSSSPTSTGGRISGTKPSSVFPPSFSYAAAAPAFANHSQRQPSTAFSSPGAGPNAVLYHRNSVPDNSAPSTVIMPHRSLAGPHDTYGLGLSQSPLSSGPSPSTLEQMSSAWNVDQTANVHINGRAGGAQFSGEHLPYGQVPNQFTGGQSYLPNEAAAFINRGQSLQAGLESQFRILRSSDDTRKLAMRSVFGRNGQPVISSAFDPYGSLNAMGGVRPTDSQQFLQESFLQNQSIYLPHGLSMQYSGLQFGPQIIHNGSLRDRDPSKQLRSPALKRFLEHKAVRNFELSDIAGHVVEFSGDQHGSRFIQTKLENASKDAKDMIFSEMAENIIPLTMDVFGNYVVQKFVEHGSQKQKEYIAEKMKNRMVDLSTQCYSCRVVQKVMQNALIEQKIALAKELNGHVLRVVKDNSGNHVVQKILEEINRSELDFIVDALRGKVMELSTHNFGCRIIQKLHDLGSDGDRAMIVSEVKDRVQELSMGQFGNYVIQKIIQGNNAEHRSIIITGIIDNLVAMCKQKFASNVVEACIKYGSATDRRRIREELNRMENGVSVLHQLANDMFGNYVLQNLLRSLKGEEQRLFAQALTAQVEYHKKSGSGRPNAAIDRLADAVEEVMKSTSAKSTSDAVASHHHHEPGPEESTPPLTETPNSPESTNPPSVGSCPSEFLPHKSESSAVTGLAITVTSEAH